MKNKALCGFVAVVVLLAALPLYAAGESVSGMPQTAADFQRAYSGTKPVIAAAKFQASKYVSNLPQPTLTFSRIRTEDIVKGQGTKPGILPVVGSAHVWSGGLPTANKPSVRS